MGTLDNIFSGLLVIIFICAIIGLFNPMIFLPRNREFKYPRLSVLALFFVVMMIITFIEMSAPHPIQEAEESSSFNFVSFFACLAFLFMVVGLFNPHIFLPRKWGIKHPRLLVSGVFGIVWILLLSIFPLERFDYSYSTKNKVPEADYYVEVDPLVIIKLMDAEKAGLLVPSTTTIKKHSNKVHAPDVVVAHDSLWAVILTEHFDSLYNRLMDCDNPEAHAPSRSDIHRKIKHFIYDEWWELMEKYDSSRVSLPICRNEYAKACKKYDKQYARYVKYGDEDLYKVEFWAESEAKRVLHDLLKDPRSLEIIGVTSINKTSKGYRCRVQYRAKNSFGGYVVDGLQLDLEYDEDNGLYRAFDGRLL